MRERRLSDDRYRVFETNHEGDEKLLRDFNTPIEAFKYIDDRRQQHPLRQHRLLRIAPRPPSAQH